MVVIFPVLIRKFSTKAVIMVGCILNVLGYVLNFFAGDSIPMLGIAAVLYGIGGIPISMLVNLLIIECADYNEWKGIQRMEGTLGSVTGFATKTGSALGAGALGILLSFSVYMAGVDQIPESAVSMIRSLFSVIPAVLWIGVTCSLLLYKLNKLTPQIRADIEAKRDEQANIENGQ